MKFMFQQRSPGHKSCCASLRSVSGTGLQHPPGQRCPCLLTLQGQDPWRPLFCLPSGQQIASAWLCLGSRFPCFSHYSLTLPHPHIFTTVALPASNGPPGSKPHDPLQTTQGQVQLLTCSLQPSLGSLQLASQLICFHTGLLEGRKELWAKSSPGL